MRILTKFPTRGRPERFLSTLKEYEKQSSGDHDIVYCISVDRDDPSVSDGLVQQANDIAPDHIHFFFGSSNNKIHAVNRDVDKALDLFGPFDVLLTASDDMVPIHKGYDDVICSDLMANFPDGDGLLWYFDGFNKKINTIAIMGVPYYNRFGYIYHPSYQTEWADVEMGDVAESLNKVFKSSSVIIKHFHPYNLPTVKKDALYQRNMNKQAISADLANYKRRKSHGFPI
jgi:hypothetical protein